MNFSNIKGSDWERFDKKFPDASTFLLVCSLKGEIEFYAKYEDTLNDWQKKRLTELKKLDLGE